MNWWPIYANSVSAVEAPAAALPGKAERIHTREDTTQVVSKE